MSLRINVANADHKNWTQPWILCFGAYGETRVLAYAVSLEDALEVCAEWLLGNRPGVFCTVEVQEEFADRLLEGLSTEDAWDTATVDTTSVLDGEHFLHSWEWSLVAENPTPKQIADLHHGRV